MITNLSGGLIDRRQRACILHPNDGQYHCQHRGMRPSSEYTCGSRIHMAPRLSVGLSWLRLVFGEILFFFLDSFVSFAGLIFLKCNFPLQHWGLDPGPCISQHVLFYKVLPWSQVVFVSMSISYVTWENRFLLPIDNLSLL